MPGKTLLSSADVADILKKIRHINDEINRLENVVDECDELPSILTRDGISIEDDLNNLQTDLEVLIRTIKERMVSKG